jgi:hypothetical protein
VVLFNTPEQRLGLARIQEAHKILNAAFDATNNVELAKVPNTPLYPWKNRVGNPNIQFLPLNTSDIQVEYLKIPHASLNDTSPVDDASHQAGVEPGVLNVYIGNTDTGILGQAELGSNIVFALHSAIGGGSHPGTLSSYALSKTLVHEIGHAFSLPHTFSDYNCDHVSVFPDVPEQIKPNFQTVLFQTSDGNWDCKNDNRFNDRLNDRYKSCLSIQRNVATSTNEMGINYMDYGVDAVSIMFTESQSLMMRTYLKSVENTSITLLDVESSSSSSSTSTLPVSTAVESVDNTTPLDVPNVESEDTTNIDPILILMIFAISIIFLIILVLVYRKYHRSKIPPTKKTRIFEHSSTISISDLESTDDEEATYSNPKRVWTEKDY